MTQKITQQVITSTVSVALLQDLFHALERACNKTQFHNFLKRAGISIELAQRDNARITHEQFVRLYQIAAVETGDEMMGLWSRPVRSGALKVICRNIYDASSVSVAMYRFTQVWSLMLDDYQLTLNNEKNHFSLRLVPRNKLGIDGVMNYSKTVNRFAHMLMLKLVHGVVSWLVGYEVPVRGVSFVFSRPHFAEDYSVLFPAQVEYEAEYSAIYFNAELALQRFNRPYADLRPFLIRAPRDWIFTTYKEHNLSMKVREFLSNPDRLGYSLSDTASAFHISRRTLIRRLANEHSSFQSIKDGLRRDFAIFDLINSNKSLDNIAHDYGFSSVSAFHRAFKHWTGNTPGEYRTGMYS